MTFNTCTVTVAIGLLALLGAAGIPVLMILAESWRRLRRELFGEWRRFVPTFDQAMLGSFALITAALIVTGMTGHLKIVRCGEPDSVTQALGTPLPRILTCDCGTPFPETE